MLLRDIPSNKQTFIDPRLIFSGDTVAKSDFIESQHFDLDSYKIIQFLSNPLDEKEYKRIVSLSKKYYPEYIEFNKDNKGFTFRTPSNMKLQIGQEFSSSYKELLSKTFTILEILTLSGYQDNVSVQILKEVSLGKKLFAQLDDETVSQYLNKYILKKRLNGQETENLSDAIKGELTNLRMANDLRWYFTQSLLVSPKNEKLYSAFIDFFLSYTKLYLNQGKKVGEFGYLEANEVIRYSKS